MRRRGHTQHEHIEALVCGAVAGLTVDVTLFPLDTVKTRLQSKRGFLASGGLRGIYSGLSSTAVGSAPTSALFFLTYEWVKRLGAGSDAEGAECGVRGHMLAASLGEVAACLLRVPCEVLKQRAQAGRVTHGHTVARVFRETVSEEGVRGLYRGYWSTIVREVPFALIQFPMWEALKRVWLSRVDGHVLLPWQGGLCGAAAGGCAAVLTTPLDVCKTRIMLSRRADPSDPHHSLPWWRVLRDIYVREGVGTLFSGVWPRFTLISLGGFIFLGAYDTAKYLLYRRAADHQDTRT